MRRKQLIDAGLVPDTTADVAEEGDEKKGGVVARKRKIKKDKVKDECKEELAES
jgi:hypothetical protein